MRPIQHVANVIVSTVATYPQLVTPEAHAGIDLARALQAGDLAILQSPELCSEILHAETSLQIKAIEVFG